MAQQVETYLAPWTTPPHPTEADIDAERAATVSLTRVKPEFNGLPIDPDFENWKPISATDRGDNNSLRLIVANDVAFRAVQSGNLAPWPNGSRLAKIAWEQELGSDGLIHPGRLIQVELMVKDASTYKETAGWGWGRWRDLDLKPYGHDSGFVNECTGCHMPIRGNDFVYTLPITTAQPAGVEVTNHRAAELPPGLPYHPLGWNAITIYVDPKYRTTATLRTLPYVKEWSAKYKDSGLVVIGVHTPEFSFEREQQNVEIATWEHRVTYPVVMDNNYEIWRSFSNQAWPAFYLIDAKRQIRYHQFGEGNYGSVEYAIQALLKEKGSQLAVPRVDEVVGHGIEEPPSCL